MNNRKKAAEIDNESNDTASLEENERYTLAGVKVIIQKEERIIHHHQQLPLLKPLVSHPTTNRSYIVVIATDQRSSSRSKHLSN